MLVGVESAESVARTPFSLASSMMTGMALFACALTRPSGLHVNAVPLVMSIAGSSRTSATERNPYQIRCVRKQGGFGPVSSVSAVWGTGIGTTLLPVGGVSGVGPFAYQMTSEYAVTRAIWEIAIVGSTS